MGCLPPLIRPELMFREKEERSGIPAGSLQPTQENREVPYSGTALSQHNRHCAYGMGLRRPRAKKAAEPNVHFAAAGMGELCDSVTVDDIQETWSGEKGAQCGNSSTGALSARRRNSQKLDLQSWTPPTKFTAR